MSFHELTGYGPGGYYYDVRDQLKRHIYGRTEAAIAAGELTRDAIKTRPAVSKRQEWIRTAFIKSIGGIDFPKTPLNAKRIGIIKEEGFHIEKIIYESRPKVYVTSNLYVPSGITSPRGAVLFVCGHHLQAKHEPEYQIVCRYLAKAGLVVLAQDPVGQGERFSYYEKTVGQTVSWGCPEHDYAGSQSFMVGDGIARYFLHDAMRGIDYLSTRSEVDPKRIGVTGNSGGGTQTSMLMMADPRIAAAAPGTFIMNRQTYMYTGGAQDAEQIWPGLTAIGWDHEDILLAMAPKPVLVLAVTYDFFPIEGTRQTVDRCKRFWDMFNKSSNLSMIEDRTTHTYTRRLAHAAAAFFSRHLNRCEIKVLDESVKSIEPAKLWCTQTGQIRGEIMPSRFVYDENFVRLKAVQSRLKNQSAENRKRAALQWLQKKVFVGRGSCGIVLRQWHTAMFEGSHVQMCLWNSQQGIGNHAFVIRDCAWIGKSIPVTMAVWEGGSASISHHAAWIQNLCAQGRAVMVLDVSGEGVISPNVLNAYNSREFYGVNHKFSDDLFWLGDSLAAMRIYDVIRAVDAIKEMPDIRQDDIRFYTYGRTNMYVELAAALDKRIRKIETVNRMESAAFWVSSRHYDPRDIRTFIMPEMLAYLDLPDVRKWIR